MLGLFAGLCINQPNSMRITDVFAISWKTKPIFAGEKKIFVLPIRPVWQLGSPAVILVHLVSIPNDVKSTKAAKLSQRPRLSYCTFICYFLQTREIQSLWKYWVMVYVLSSFWHEDMLTWKYFQHYWCFVQENNQWPVSCSHTGR